MGRTLVTPKSLRERDGQKGKRTAKKENGESVERTNERSKRQMSVHSNFPHEQSEPVLLKFPSSRLTFLLDIFRESLLCVKRFV